MKLDDLKKENVFKVPDRYFSELPGKIQSRIPSKRPARRPVFTWNLALKMVPTMAAVLLILYFVLPKSQKIQDPVELIAMVDTEDVIAYLELTDITTDEIIEGLDLASLDLELDLEDSFLPNNDEMNEDDLDKFIEDLELESELL
jgi:hypothetical protein